MDCQPHLTLDSGERALMQAKQSKLYIGNILGKKIVTAEGKTIGHVADIQLSPAPEYAVVALIFGRRGWLFRLHVLNPFASLEKRNRKPKTVPWDAVDRIEGGIVILKPGYIVRN